MKTIFIFLFAFLSTAHIALSANSSPAKLIFKPSEQAILEPIISSSLSKAIKYYRTSFGLKLTRSFILVASQDSGFIAEANYKGHRKRFPLNAIAPSIKRKCNKARKATAVANIKTLSICFKSSKPITKKWLQKNQRLIDTIIRHELMHFVEFQLSRANYYRIGQRPRNGPKWLSEGVARYAEKNYVQRTKPRTKVLKDIIKRSKVTKKNLKQYVEGGGILPSEGYPLAELGAYLLIERYGMDRVFKYWKSLRNGARWERRFKKAFGIDMNDFMQDVEVLRLSAAKAERWITAE